MKYILLILIALSLANCFFKPNSTDQYDEQKLQNDQKFAFTPVHKSYNVEKTANPINSGIYICDQAKRQNILKSGNIKIFAEQNREKIKNFAHRMNTEEIFKKQNVFKQMLDAKPTEVINMNGSPEFFARLKIQAQKKADLQNKINQVDFNARAPLHPFHTDFFFSPLFTPDAFEFLINNRQLVLEVFPDVNQCTINTFTVAPNQYAYGVHNDVAIGFAFANAIKNSEVLPNKYYGFHTALGHEIIDGKLNQPFNIFEKIPSKSYTPYYAYDHIRRNADNYEEIQDELEAAVYIRYHPNEVDQFISAGNYIQTKMIESDYCRLSNQEDAHGTVWPLAPGQALYFDTYKYHGGLLHKADEYRTTVNMKCTDQYKPFSKETIEQEINLINPNFFQSQVINNKNADCLFKIFGYEDTNDFLKLFFGDKYEEGKTSLKDIPEMHSGIFGYEMRNEERINFIYEGIKRHNERNKAFFEQDEYQISDEVLQCMEQYYEDAYQKEEHKHVEL
ncbi:hypothetical protein PPERSA_10058 [Pseudocohnilembus persalinus]|uniref:Phytanoyl-CoA dioxygenase n=1 Tax=Pseudocohnilembus persalinus TaxID=266149 RepID=A0A0V0QJJ5_PSEPJ|nr:hypothetical protein PPERSA_10058 [Pseudocohnilembus persalinus]|eukprot:KRX02441.1 hypothetical protein PPERSA_10058 [Pseudocohnilembus persalinus]